MGTTEAWCGKMLEALAEGVVVHDANSQIEACNGAAERLLGLTVNQMRGLTPTDPRWHASQERDGSAFPGDSHPAIVALQTGQPQTGVIVRVDKPDGTRSPGSPSTHTRSCGTARRKRWSPSSRT